MGQLFSTSPRPEVGSATTFGASGVGWVGGVVGKKNPPPPRSWKLGMGCVIVLGPETRDEGPELGARANDLLMRPQTTGTSRIQRPKHNNQGDTCIAAHRH